MTIYKVPIIGDGETMETAFRPDVPEGVSWGAVHIDAKLGYCLIETPDDEPADLAKFDHIDEVVVPAGIEKAVVCEAIVAELVAGAARGEVADADMARPR